MRRKDELAPEASLLGCVDVEANVVLGSFAEDLLVDARSIGPLSEVVRDRRAAPANVKWKLDPSAGLGPRRVVEIFRYGYRPWGGA